ncbi:hypothetical protein H312_03620 [Anncaliia algerae PRA339]|uniref:Uncharacterized protein n=2 Tax=Anncaliia algerae PRA339 TaxID=1288291 RepID=A0A059EWA5_9MICR|nr:hypothetical protein H312_03620 [Anncaliia algerae PRA339]
MLKQLLTQRIPFYNDLLNISLNKSNYISRTALLFLIIPGFFLCFIGMRKFRISSILTYILIASVELCYLHEIDFISYRITNPYKEINSNLRFPLLMSYVLILCFICLNRNVSLIYAYFLTKFILNDVLNYANTEYSMVSIIVLGMFLFINVLINLFDDLFYMSIFALTGAYSLLGSIFLIYMEIKRKFDPTYVIKFDWVVQAVCILLYALFVYSGFICQCKLFKNEIKFPF